MHEGAPIEENDLTPEQSALESMEATEMLAEISTLAQEGTELRSQVSDAEKNVSPETIEPMKRTWLDKINKAMEGLDKVMNRWDNSKTSEVMRLFLGLGGDGDDTMRDTFMGGSIR